MNGGNTPAIETPDQPEAVRTELGWGFWALWVAALALVGALSYRLAAEAPGADYTVPPVALVIFGLLAGVVQGFALRRQVPPVRRWMLASSLAGLLAAVISLITTFWARTLIGLLAGWAYAWAAYGAVSGVLLPRISPGRWLMLASLAGWALAGILSGAVGWIADVCLVRDTTPTFAPLPVSSRTWSMVPLAVVGAVCGATGGAITGAALVLLPRRPVLPRRSAASTAKDTKRVIVAGVVNGLIAAVLCIYLALPVFTVLSDGSRGSIDITSGFVYALIVTPLCMPTLALVSVPLSIACGYAGLEIARTRGRPNPKPWIWGGAAVGGVAGVVLGSLLIFIVGYL